MLAQSIGLYADRIILPDTLSHLLTLTNIPPEELSRLLFAELASLTELQPLIDAGVVSFGRPPHGFCERCDAAMTSAARTALQAILDSAVEEIESITLEEAKNQIFVCVELSSEYSDVAYSAPAEPEEVTTLESLRMASKSELKQAVMNSEKLRALVELTLRCNLYPVADAVRSAQRTGGVLTAGRRAEADFVRIVERQGLSTGDNLEWDLSRAVQLPWIKDLSVAQVVQLKSEAKHALPSLRDLLARRLSNPAVQDSALDDVVRELRAEAMNVEAELGAWQRSSGRRFHLGLGGLGLSFIVYGLTVARDVAATALGSFMMALATAHPEEQKARHEIERLKTMPGYVLLRAKNLLGHAD